MAVFYNQATLSYQNTSVASNVVSGEILDVLSAQKTAFPIEYAVGDPADGTITYVISLVNTGSVALTGLTVTDDLGAYPFGSGQAVPLTYVDGSVRYYQNGVLQAAPTVTAGAPLVFSCVSVPAGGNAILVYDATVNAFAPPGTGGSIINTATVTGLGIGESVTASAEIGARSGPVLSISKSVSPSAVAENEQLTYTFIIENRGNEAAVATDNLVVTDLFSPILRNLSVTLDGVTLSEPADYTYNEASGLFTTVQSRITVPAATYVQNPVSGAWSFTPGTATLRVTGTV